MMDACLLCVVGVLVIWTRISRKSEVAVAASEAPAEAADTKIKKKRAWGIAVVLGVILLIAFCLVLFCPVVKVRHVKITHWQGGGLNESKTYRYTLPEIYGDGVTGWCVALAVTLILAVTATLFCSTEKTITQKMLKNVFLGRLILFVITFSGAIGLSTPFFLFLVASFAGAKKGDFVHNEFLTHTDSVQCGPSFLGWLAVILLILSIVLFLRTVCKWGKKLTPNKQQFAGKNEAGAEHASGYLLSAILELNATEGAEVPAESEAGAPGTEATGTEHAENVPPDMPERSAK